MTGLDTNILIQMAIAAHSEYSATMELFQIETERGELFAVVPLVVTEFLHAVTDSRRFNPPMPQTVALDWIEGFLTLPQVKSMQTQEAGLQLTFQWMRQYQLGRKRILDTRLAATLYTCGITRLLTSNPRDFSVFQVFEIITP